MVLQCKSQHRFAQALAELKDQVQLRNSTESGYVEMMAIARWRQMRVWAVQKAAIELEMARVESASTESARVESGHDAASETAAVDLTPVVLATPAYRTLSGNSFLDKAPPLRNLLRPAVCQSPGRHSKNAPSGIARCQRFRVPPIQPDRLRPHLATPLTAPTFMDPSDPREKVILQNEPTAQNET
jgi:hypothetical protein